MKHICTYCGGWEDDTPVDPKFSDATTTAWRIDYSWLPGGGEKRDVCVRCMVAGFDKLFGSLDKCDECGEKNSGHHICGD